MRSVKTAAWFVLACGVVGFLLSVASHPGRIGQNLFGGALGLLVGFLLMLALRSRP